MVWAGRSKDMLHITDNAVIIVDGVEYAGNDLLVNEAGDRFLIRLNNKKLDHMNFNRGAQYEATLDAENGVLEYDCRATQTNGHVMNFKLRFPSKNVYVRRT